MDAFSASLMADKREIVFAPTVYKFQTFAQMAEEFKLGERDVVLTNEFIYTPFMKELGLKCNFVFQEKFGAGEPSEAMIQTMYDAIPYDSYDRVIAVGGGAIMDLCKLLGCKRPDTVHNLYFKRFPVVSTRRTSSPSPPPAAPALSAPTSPWPSSRTRRTACSPAARPSWAWCPMTSSPTRCA